MKRNKRFWFGTLALAALALTGCHRSAGISVDGQSITLHATAAPAATITKRGSLSVGTRAIKVTPDQRHALIGYYRDVLAFQAGQKKLRDAGLDMAGQALDLAGHAIGRTVGLADASSAHGRAAAQAMQEHGEKLQQRVLGLCRKARAIRHKQARLITALPALAPYAGQGKAFRIHCQQLRNDTPIPNTPTVRA